MAADGEGVGEGEGGLPPEGRQPEGRLTRKRRRPGPQHPADELWDGRPWGAMGVPDRMDGIAMASGAEVEVG